MTRVAGEVADGLLVHGFSTERYLREVTVPILESGLAASGRSRADFQLQYPLFVCSGTTDEERETAAAGVRKQIAFYASTPAYRSVLELHGWGELQTELNAMSKQGQWEEMGARIDDDVLDAFAVVAAPDDVADAIIARVGDLVDRISFYTPFRLDQDLADHIALRLHAA
jgi:probable F420-dependent oxidoreductase